MEPNDEDELVDYDEEDLDSDEDQDCESDDAGSLDSGPWSAPSEKMASDLRSQRAGASGGLGSSPDDRAKQSVVELKKGKAAATSSLVVEDDPKMAEEECDFADSDEGSEHGDSPGKGVQRINESRPSNLKVSQL